MDLCLETLDKENHKRSEKRQEAGTGTRKRVALLGLSSIPSLVGHRAFLVPLKTKRVVWNPSLGYLLDCFDCIKMYFICYIQYLYFILRTQNFPPHYKLRKEAVTVSV